MFLKLLFLFTVIPIIELALLIEIGRRIGSLPTVGIVVITGIIGAGLAKQQGFQTWYQIRSEANDGRVPGGALLDGLFVLVGALTLITPGLLTDLLGFSLLIPVTRKLWHKWIKRMLDIWIKTGSLHIIRWR